MRISDFIRQCNKHVFNKLTTWFCRRGIGPLSLITHWGRTSGRVYRIPALATYVDQWIIIPLSYGDHVDWLRNILAQDKCQILHKKDQFAATHLEIIPWDAALSHLPEGLRKTFARFHIETFLRMEHSPDST